MVEIPNNGKTTNGRNAVTATLVASVAHQIAIHVANAATYVASSGKPSGRKNTNTTIAIMGPETNPNIFGNSDFSDTSSVFIVLITHWRSHIL